VSGKGGVLVCVFNWVCAPRIDAAKMRLVDRMFSSFFVRFVFLGCCAVAVMFLLLLYGNYIYVWSFGGISVLSRVQHYATEYDVVVLLWGGVCYFYVLPVYFVGGLPPPPPPHKCIYR
jgi:hypothetical protein